MSGCPRISYNRRMHYATRSNRVRKIRTPGNRLKFQQIKKRSQGPHTPWVLGHKRIAGTKCLRQFDARRETRHAKSVSRAYGGVLSAEQVRDRVIRAFLVEEQRTARNMEVTKKMYKKLKTRTDRKQKKKAAKAAGVVKAATKKGGVVGGKKAAAGNKKQVAKGQSSKQAAAKAPAAKKTVKK